MLSSQILRTRLQVIALIAVLLGVVAMLSRPDAPEAAAQAHGPIPWSDSLAKAKQMATQSHKIIMVDCYANWCVPCKIMLGTTYLDPRVVELAKSFLPVLIDVEKQRDVAKELHISKLPTVLFINPKGKVVAYSVGEVDADHLLKTMQEALKKN